MGKPVLQWRTVALFGGKAGEWRDAEKEVMLSGLNEFRIKPEPPVERHEFDYARTMFAYELNGPLAEIKAPDGRRFLPDDYEITLVLTGRFVPGYLRNKAGEVCFFATRPDVPGDWQRVEVVTTGTAV